MVGILVSTAAVALLGTVAILATKVRDRDRLTEAVDAWLVDHYHCQHSHRLLV